MKYKEFEVQLKESGEETPRITAYASTFDREPDSYGDVVAKGAFTDSLKKWDESGMRIPLLYGHRTDDPMMNLGGVVEAGEDEKGLLITAEFDMDNPNAVKARRDVIAKTLCKMSFAYDVLDEAPVELEGGIKANELRKLEIYEVSLVPIPANQHAVVVDVKAATAEAEADEKAGRRNSAADESTLERIGELADEIKDEVSGLIGADDEEEAEEPQEAKEQSEEPNEANADAEEKAADAAETEDADASATSEKENNMEKSILSEIGEVVETVEEREPRTLGEYALKSLDLTALRNGMSKSAGTGFGFKTYTDPQVSQQIVEYDKNVVDVAAMRELAIRNLFGQETISGNALKYFILGAKEDNSTPAPKGVAEAAAKPQFHIVESSATVTLQKVAGWFYETDELLEDNAFLKSAIDNRGLFELDAAIENYLLTTLLATSGLGAATYAHNGNVSADDIFAAMMTIKTASNLNADAIVINPADYQRLRLAKDNSGAGQYYGGGYFYGPFGNGQLSAQPGLWGLNTVITSSIAAGTVLVGAFKRGASVITKQGGGARIEIVTGDHDDAIYNRVTVVVEERLGLATRIPSAFVKITEAAS